MTARRVTIPSPLAPRPEILQDGRHVLAAEHESGRVLLVYDPQLCAAGVFHVEQQLWKIYVPLPLLEFLNVLETQRYKLPAGVDLETWLAAICGGDAARLQPN